MLGAFGDVVFNVSREVVHTFKGFTRKSSASFAEHALVEGKPLLQFTGEGLDEISFSIQLDINIGLSPIKEIDKLREIKKAGEALPIIVGSYVLGHFALISLDETWSVIDNKGRLIKATVTLNLKEFV